VHFVGLGCIIVVTYLQEQCTWRLVSGIWCRDVC